MNQRQKIVLAIVFLALFSLLLVVLLGENGWFELRRLEQAQRNLVNTNHLLTQENQKMSRSIYRLRHDPSYIEYIARRELRMVHSDDLIFKFRQPVGKP